MTGRIIILVLGIFALGLHVQTVLSQTRETVAPPHSSTNSDELFKHLAAAESHQRSGDLAGAAIENKAVVGIALERLGNIAIEEGRYVDAVNILKESLGYGETAPRRTRLAIAYLRQNLVDNSLAEARTAVSLDPKHLGAHYILGNIYYAKEDYKSALPSLEKALSLIHI